MSEQPRRHLPVSEKVAAVRRHLLEGTPVSQLCDELGIKPTVFYSWQKLLFENAHLAFENGRKSKATEDAKDKKIEQLEAKLQRKNEVLAELMEEHTSSLLCSAVSLGWAAFGFFGRQRPAEPLAQVHGRVVDILARDSCFASVDSGRSPRSG